MTTHTTDLGGDRPQYRVLLAIGDTEANALAQARYVASLPTAPDSVLATLTHVLHGEELQTPREFRSAQRVGAVRHAADWLAERGIETEIRDVEHPYPPTEGIVSLADAIDADAIVLSGRKRGAVESVLFGAVVQSVMRRTTRPVVVVDPDAA
ncbi:universal stress protein [Salinigranum salinum]|uniref:universal stress protein n=1 Tax=Salinigranum salinum TaxID=1364937 RepID=UPI001260F983|nr:universal stress protein [Salinigranum salinum]